MSAASAPESSTWTFTCVNHPHLRWTKTKCGPGFIGRGVLMFEGAVMKIDGEERRVPGGPFTYTESQLDARDSEFKRHFLERYVAECDCPYTDLRVHAKEYQPIREPISLRAIDPVGE